MSNGTGKQWFSGARWGPPATWHARGEALASIGGTAHKSNVKALLFSLFDNVLLYGIPISEENPYKNFFVSKDNSDF